jgi:hypothetical protein
MQPTKTGEKSNETHEIDFFYSQKLKGKCKFVFKILVSNVNSRY